MAVRATAVAVHGDWPADRAVDRVTLDHHDRHRRRLRLTTEGGQAFLLDLERATVLNDGDGLRTETGDWIAVAAAPEDLLEVTAASPGGLARLAWHIGNRHCPAQIETDRVLIRADHVLAEMLIGLGATVRPVRRAFSPEAGAYHGHGGGAHRDHG